MKIINYKKLITGSLLTALILTTPIASFAKENGKDDDDREKNGKFEQKREKSWFSSNWFENKSSKNITTVATISDLTVTSNKATKATIKWNTDVRSNSMIWYSTTTPVDTTKAPNMKRNDRTLKHKFEIKKLQPNTLYYVVVGNGTMGGVGKSTEMSFTTGSFNSNESMPVITSVTGPATIKKGEVATFILTANDPQNKTLTYGVDWADQNTIAPTAFTSPTTLTHTYNTVGIYVVKFTVTNSDGKKVTYPMKVTVTTTPTPDTTAPVISELSTNVSGTTVVVSWKTNEPSNSSIFYSKITPVDVNALTTTKIENATLVKNHSIAIPSLTSSTLYHFIIKSADSSNNIASSSEVTFATN